MEKVNSFWKHCREALRLQTHYSWKTISSIQELKQDLEDQMNWSKKPTQQNSQQSLVFTSRDTDQAESWQFNIYSLEEYFSALEGKVDANTPKPKHFLG